jgi:hypothetical protein
MFAEKMLDFRDMCLLATGWMSADDTFQSRC